MFNSYIAERRRAKAVRVQQSHSKQVEIRKRYHTEIQPILLDHYKKRLKSFILKMHQNPVIINPENLLPPLCETARFTFKNAEDWKSILPSRQREEKKWHQTVMQKRKTLEKIDDLSYKPRLHEFRQRDKDKEIHAPMRYKTTEVLPDPEKVKKKFMIHEIKKKKSRVSSKVENPGSTIRESAVSFSNNSSKEPDDTQFNVRGKSDDNIEIEAMLYEKQREPDEKKLHFKKIADMALNSNDNTEKRQLREILRKTGFSKIKRIANNTDSTEPDFFTALVERVSIK